MDRVPFLVILATGAILFALLLRARRRSSLEISGTADMAMAAMASINLASALGLGWFAVSMLYTDGFMALEHLILACLILFLVGTTAVAVPLRRRRMIKRAMAMLAAAALPTIAVYLFLFYLDAHPIDWR